MENQIALKITLPQRGQSKSITRKCLHPRRPPPAWRSIHKLVRERFGINEDFTLTWIDSDGDTITLSSDEELLELFGQLEQSTKLLRFQIAVNEPFDNTSSYAPSQADSDLLSHPASSIVDVPVLGFSRLSTDEAASSTAASTEYDSRSVAESEGTDVPDSGVKKGKGRAAPPSLTDEELSWAHVGVEDFGDFLAEQSFSAQSEDVTAEAVEPTTPTVEATDTRSPSPTPTVVAEPSVEAEDPADTPAEPTPPTPMWTRGPPFAHFLNTLPVQAEQFATHAEQFATHFAPFLQDPTHENFLHHLGSAPSELPALARGVARDVVAEVNQAVADMLAKVKRETDGIAREFREVTAELERVRSERRAAEQATTAQAQETHAPTEVQEEEAVEGTADARRRAKLERKEKMQAALEKMKASKERRRAEKEQIKSQIAEDASLEAEAVAIGAATSPFDDVYGVFTEDQEPQSGRSPRHRDHSHHHHHHASPSSPRRRRPKSLASAEGDATVPEPTAAASSSLKDDFFHRKVSMPGTFTAVPSQPAPATTSQGSWKQKKDFATEKSTLLGIGSYPTLPRMPGAFSFDPYVPVASTSREIIEPEWAEVTPSKLSKAIAELGFDTKEIGVKIAIERSWEEKRGKPLAEMVASVMDKIVA